MLVHWVEWNHEHPSILTGVRADAPAPLGGFPKLKTNGWFAWSSGQFNRDGFAYSLKK